MTGARANPIGAFAAGYGTFTAPIFGSFGALFAVVMINSFVLTTLDTSVRLGRFIVHELGNDAFFLVRNRLSATLLIVVAAWILASTGNVWTLWQMFGASNQLVAALALIVVTAWLVRHRRPSIYTLIPAVFMLVTDRKSVV
mgnify:CR=1 FL=1